MTDMSIFTNSGPAAAENATAYIAAVLGLVGDRDPMQVLRQTPDALSRTLDTLSEELVGRPEAPGKWSVGQVLHHLADTELAWAYRLRMVLAHDRPTLTAYDQDLWAARLRYNEGRAEEALERFGVLRRSNLHLLEQASAADLQRVGVHVERGEESVAHMVRLNAGHDLLHLRQVDRILGRAV